MNPDKPTCPFCNDKPKDNYGGQALEHLNFLQNSKPPFKESEFGSFNFLRNFIHRSTAYYDVKDKSTEEERE